MKRERFNQEYYDRYINGETLWDISKKENKSYRNIFEAVFDNRFEAKLLPDSEKDYICEKYLKGVSSVALGKRYGINHHAIAVVLEERGIKRNSSLSTRKYSVNEHYFDQIDTPNKAYVLGLLYADGNNCIEKYTVRIQLQERDKDILEKVRKELKYDKELSYVDCSKRIYGNGYVSKNMYSLDVYSKHMCYQLEKVGVVPNKSLILEFPDFLDKKLIPHFLRGYMDGDGYISKKQGYVVNFTSTEQFCLSVQKIIKEELGIDGTIDDATCHNGITKVFSFSKYKDSKLYLDYIYQNADIYLQRKYDLYINRFVDNKVMNNTLVA